jgi:hypothetical protein
VPWEVVEMGSVREFRNVVASVTENGVDLRDGPERSN